jgi:hypothetical protein
MRIFRAEINGIELEFVCESSNTRNGFKHTCTTLKNGQEVGKCKICYLNRTWERYEYESVVHKAIMKLGLSVDETENLKNKIDGRG